MLLNILSQKKQCFLAYDINSEAITQDRNYLLSNDEIKDMELLQTAADEMLETTCEEVLHRDTSVYSDEVVEIHKNLVNYVTQKTTRSEDGRFVMPLLWNPRVSHLLGHNFSLSKQILMSLLKKYKVDKNCSLQQIDKVFKVFAPV